jgi:hypothetical protein
MAPDPAFGNTGPTRRHLGYSHAWSTTLSTRKGSRYKTVTRCIKRVTCLHSAHDMGALQ